MGAMILIDHFAAPASRPGILFGKACGAQLKRSPQLLNLSLRLSGFIRFLEVIRERVEEIKIRAT